MQLALETEVKTKICSTCKTEKIFEHFSKNKSCKYGVMSLCKKCDSDRNKKWRKDNLEKDKQNSKKWRENNLDKILAKNSKHRATKANSTPPWLTTEHLEEMTELHAIAKERSIVTGRNYHVDHIHPLHPPKVVEFEDEMIGFICSLHVPWNLQILEHKANLAKSNKFEPYIESDCKYLNPWEI